VKRKSGAAVIDLKNVSIRRGVPILENISWRVAAGEHWAVLGTNGSGKTSLLNALAGYLAPSTGEMRVFGQRYGRADWRDLREKIGLVSSALLQRVEGDETALETVLSGRRAMLYYWGPVRPDERAEALGLLRRAECGALAGRPWSVLSQGERQRVFIARALMADFRLLVLDEPCAGLDPVARERFLKFIDRLARRRGSPPLILATHHVEEITPAFSHVLILKKGRLAAAGPIARFLSSEVLSEAFEAGIRVVRSRGRYSLAVRPDKRTFN
jgi:iron complex transport system ATP-binding protein